MNEGALVSLVALAAWLVLAGSAFRAHRVSGRTTIAMALTWAAIFGAVALAISLVL
jgi:hypothetical protein